MLSATRLAPSSRCSAHVAEVAPEVRFHVQPQPRVQRRSARPHRAACRGRAAWPASSPADCRITRAAIASASRSSRIVRRLRRARFGCGFFFLRREPFFLFAEPVRQSAPIAPPSRSARDDAAADEAAEIAENGSTSPSELFPDADRGPDSAEPLSEPAHFAPFFAPFHADDCDASSAYSLMSISSVSVCSAIA